MQIETEKLIADILQKEMNLSDAQIWIYNQDFVMPKTSGLFVVVGFSHSKPISNNTRFKENDTGGLVEVQTSNVCEYIQINLMSRNNEARQRKNEALMALASYYSQQIQDKYSCKIAKIPQNFINISDVEGATNINRYNITVPVLVWYEKEKQVSTGYGADYYDSFENNVIIDDKGQFEFNIGDT